MGWDDNGLPTERRVQNYFGVRCDPVAALRRRLHPAREARPQEAGPDQPAQLHRAVRAARRARTRRPSSRCGASSASRSTGTRTYTTIGDHSQHRQPARVPAQLRPRRGLPLRRRRPCGTSPSRPPSPRPSSRRATTPATTTASRSTGRRRQPGPHRDHPSRADPERRRADRAPRRRALPGASFGTTVTSPVFGVEIPVLAHHAAEPDKGAGIAMCCTFGDLTDVMWWRELEPPGPHRGRPRRPAAAARRPSGWRPSRASTAYAELAGKTTFSAREAMVALLRESGDLDGEPKADPADGELLREGRQAARDRRHPPVVHHQRRPRRRAAQGDARPAARRSPGSPPT